MVKAARRGGGVGAAAIDSVSMDDVVKFRAARSAASIFAKPSG